MSTGPKAGWGGPRPGSGPKKKTLSLHQVQLMLEKAKEYAEKKKKTIDDILLEFIYDEKSPLRDRAACIKLWKEYTIAKMQEGGETDKEAGPGIYLPGEKPDQTKVVELKKTG